MTEQYRIPTYVEILEIERKAQAMRAQAMRAGAIQFGRWLRDHLTFGLRRPV